ncbi:MAG TPA: response regulator [Geobacteraceae bacterium]|nr:response regulator [Geobacteraceae bacterium]
MGEKIKVLVVDDDRRMVKTMCDILRVKGYEAESAYTGEEALEKVMRRDQDCVLMDIKMPGISGIEAVEKIRDMKPGLPVVLMSAYATEEQADHARKHGAYTVLTKPIDVQMVLTFLSLLRKENSILIVDDDPEFCKTLKDIFQARGYEVESEFDPGRVLDRLEQSYRLVVILDLKLGTASGLDVLKEIRAKYPSKPVIMVTAYGGEMVASIEQGLQIGAYTCMYKPLEVDQLVRVIETIKRIKMREALGEPNFGAGG